MKIAVVTVHYSANFGSFLQAYALKYVLEQDGHDVSFVITRDKEYVRGLFYKLNLCREMVKHPYAGVSAQHHFPGKNPLLFLMPVHGVMQ